LSTSPHELAGAVFQRTKKHGRRSHETQFASKYIDYESVPSTIEEWNNNQNTEQMSEHKKAGREEFLTKIGILSQAGVGVILTRTREPHRAEEALKTWTFSQKRWQEAKEDLKAPVTPADKSVEFYVAMKKISDVDGGGTKAWHDSVSVVHYPHWTLPKHAGAIQLLKEYSRDFPETKQRVVLLCPEGFILPSELQNDISVLDFDLPTSVELREVYDTVMESAEITTKKKANYTTAEIDMIVSSGAGMTQAEFETALSKSIITHKAKWPDIPIEDLNKVILETKTEVVKRSEVLELMEAGSMEDIGGLDLAKEWIVQRKLDFTPEAREFGVDTPKGVLCIGCSGSGKSLFAKATAGVLGQPLVRFDISKVFGSLQGQSEGRVRAALKQIDALSPVVCLLDECDKAGLNPNQGGMDNGTSMRVLGNILTHMQESKAPVFWVLSANRATSLAPELLQRVEEKFAFLLPNSTERREILKIQLRLRKQDHEKIDDLELAVTASEGFVGREIGKAVNSAVSRSFRENKPLTGKTLSEEFEIMTSTSVAFAEDTEAMRSWAETNARPSSSKEGEGAVLTFSSPRVRRRNLG